MALAGLIQQVLEKKEGLNQNVDEDERRTLRRRTLPSLQQGWGLEGRGGTERRSSQVKVEESGL